MQPQISQSTENEPGKKVAILDFTLKNRKTHKCFIVEQKSLLRSNNQFFRIRDHGNPETIELHLSEMVVIKPTDTLRYVGLTENYIFFWNKITKQNFIYPKSEIKLIIVNYNHFKLLVHFLSNFFPKRANPTPAFLNKKKPA